MTMVPICWIPGSYLNEGQPLVVLGREVTQYRYFGKKGVSLPAAPDRRAVALGRRRSGRPVFQPHGTWALRA